MTLLADMFNTSVTAEDILNKIEEDKKSDSGFVPLLKNEFRPTEKPDGTGQVIMRILPALGEFKNTAPHIDVRSHYVNFKGAIYDALCPGFFDDNCPICSFSRENKIWEKGSKYNDLNYGKWENRRMTLPRFSAQEERWVNVYIVDDLVDPENNGKIFQWKMPRAVSNLYESFLKGDPAINQKPEIPSDLFEGRNLYLRYEPKGGFRNYEQSKFLDKSAITDKMGNELLQNPDFGKQIKEEMQDLYDLIDPETRVYTPEEAKKRFSDIMEAVNETMNGDSGSEDRLSDGFDSVQLKDNKIAKDELEELTGGALDSGSDSNPLDDINSLLEEDIPVDMGTSKETHKNSMDEIDDLLKELEI